MKSEELSKEDHFNFLQFVEFDFGDIINLISNISPDEFHLIGANFQINGQQHLCSVYLFKYQTNEV